MTDFAPLLGVIGTGLPTMLGLVWRIAKLWSASQRRSARGSARGVQAEDRRLGMSIDADLRRLWLGRQLLVESLVESGGMVDTPSLYDRRLSAETEDRAADHLLSGESHAGSSPASPSAYRGIDRGVMNDIEMARMRRTMRESGRRQRIMLEEYFTRLRNGEDGMSIYTDLVTR